MIRRGATLSIDDVNGCSWDFGLPYFTSVGCGPAFLGSSIIPA